MPAKRCSIFASPLLTLLATMTLSIVGLRSAAAENIFAGHPAEATLAAIFPGNEQNPPQGFVPTMVTKADYLNLIAADIAFFAKCQNEKGAIIDPYSHAEVQYSTPSFAFATAILVKEAHRADLLDPSSRALTRAITDLIQHKAADRHSDFYIPLIMHAYTTLQGLAPAAVVNSWQEQLRQIVPEKTYRMDMRGMNWNLVSSSGELLRRQASLVPDENRPTQLKYLEESLAIHEKDFTPFGLIHDPNAPMAYDAFSRLWLDDVMAKHAYDGTLAGKIQHTLSDGALSALLLISPSGEWASGGRSAFHQWNEAETAVISEIHADQWHQAGRDDLAGAFKRAAHLSFQSMRRWQRPSGELWIIKNRAEPASRLAFESYSSNSQYNLLPMAMLALAYTHADDSIAERPIPSERAAYVFDLCATFHKVAAAAGGYYLLIDTSADPHYNATGLQRVHRAGVSFPALSDSAAADRAYEPKNSLKLAVAPGIAWKNTATDTWHSLADFAGTDSPFLAKAVMLHTNNTTPEKVSFDLTYTLAGPGEDGRHVIEHYVITGGGVECTSELIASTLPAAFRGEFPALVNDGAADLPVTVTADSLMINNHGSFTSWKTLTETTSPIELGGPRIVTHNGYVQKAIAPLAGPAFRYRVTVSQ